jgi:1-phosphofructokinase family hexose kinase
MIHVFSPNTAHEVILRVPRLAAGAVHRASEGHRRVGGKGVNVARACGRMGTPVRLVAIADAQGAAELAREPDLADSEVDMVPLDGQARTDVIVAEDGGRATVVNGVGDPLAAGIAEGAADRLVDALRTGDIVVLAGSLPRGAPADLYGAIVAEGRSRGARVIVDASGGWLRAALAAGPAVCKVNVHELADAFDREVRECWQQGGALMPAGCALVLSRAAAGARAWSEGRRCGVRVPAQPVASGVGAGDAMTAGIAAGLAAGSPLIDAVAQGAAWGAAAVRELDLTLDPAVARTITTQTRIVGCRPDRGPL